MVSGADVWARCPGVSGLWRRCPGAGDGSRKTLALRAGEVLDCRRAPRRRCQAMAGLGRVLAVIFR